MDANAIREAARRLASARRTGELIERLPERCRPRDTTEAYAVELALLEELGETLAGWKVSLTPGHGLMAGLLVASRLHRAGAALDGRVFSMRGIEIEIAFRFDRAFAPRADDYTRLEIEQGLTALVGAEIVDTRFTSYDGTPPLERMADFLANGAYVEGPARADWKAFDLAQLESYVAFDGREQARRVGGHPSRDPLLPALALVNKMRASAGVSEGMIVTTGSYAGMSLASPACGVVAGFVDFGEVAFSLR